MSSQSQGNLVGGSPKCLIQSSISLRASRRACWTEIDSFLAYFPRLSRGSSKLEAPSEGFGRTIARPPRFSHSRLIHDR